MVQTVQQGFKIQNVGLLVRLAGVANVANILLGLFRNNHTRDCFLCGIIDIVTKVC